MNIVPFRHVTWEVLALLWLATGRRFSEIALSLAYHRGEMAGFV